MENKVEIKLPCSLGAGMGYLGEVYGAVTGALLALGIKYGQDTEDVRHAKALTYLLDRDFASRFIKINGSINCRELINVDLNDENQRQAVNKWVYTNQSVQNMQGMQ
jgi:C_GCAxxG_C_C family probable redox protein